MTNCCIKTEMYSKVGSRQVYVLIAVFSIVVIVAAVIGLLLGLVGLKKDVQITPAPRPALLRSTTSTASPEKKSAFGAYRYGAVATDTKICSRIGSDIMVRKGGTAVDAAIATMLCVGVVNAHSCGIGGGHVMTVYGRPKGSQELVMKTIIGREMAPGAATQNMYVNKTGASKYGALAVGVPGEIAGFYEAWQMFGKLEWKDLLEPIINLCKYGYKVERALASSIKSKEASIRADPGLRETFLKRDGTIYKEGDMIYRRKLGATLQKLALNPTDLYNGSLAQDLVDDLNDLGGIMTVADLNNYRAVVKDPLSVHLNNGDYTLFVPRPPSGGAVLAFIMNILDGYDFSSSSINTANKVLTYHRILEANKFAYGKRTNLGDEDFVDVSELLKNLTSDIYAEDIRKRINDTHTQPLEYYEPTFDVVENDGTAHMSVLAPDGSAVSMTSTINLIFGAAIMGNRTGIIFNDQMDDFSTPGLVNYFGVPASPANFIRPGKRPLSSMCPAIILDKNGTVVEVIGASGGTRITTATAFVAMHNLWFKERIDNSIDFPRVHHQLLPPEVDREPNLPQDIIDGLQEKGHQMKVKEKIAVVQAVHNVCGDCGQACAGRTCVHAASDKRKGGEPDGF